MKDLILILKGIYCFNKSNCKSAIVLLAYHHPKSITWRWSIWLYFNRNMFLEYKKYNGNHSLQIPFIFLTFDQQKHIWRK